MLGFRSVGLWAYPPAHNPEAVDAVLSQQAKRHDYRRTHLLSAGIEISPVIMISLANCHVQLSLLETHCPHSIELKDARTGSS